MFEKNLCYSVDINEMQICMTVTTSCLVNSAPAVVLVNGKYSRPSTDPPTNRAGLVSSQSCLAGLF